MRSIIIVATLDTKGDQIKYLKKLIKGQGKRVLIIDVGVLGTPTIMPDIDHHKVAESVGSSIKDLSTLSSPRDPNRRWIKWLKVPIILLKSCVMKTRSTAYWPLEAPWARQWV